MFARLLRCRHRLSAPVVALCSLLLLVSLPAAALAQGQGNGNGNGGGGVGTMDLPCEGDECEDPDPGPTYDVDVVPYQGTLPDQRANTGGHIADFTVRNDGSQTETFSIHCERSANVACTSLSRTSITLGPGASGGVRLTFSIGAPGAAYAGIRATDTDLAGNTGFGRYNFTAVRYGVSVTPDGATGTPQPTSRWWPYETFTVTNTGTKTATYTLTCTSSAELDCRYDTLPNTVTLAAGASTTVTVEFGTPGVGSGTLTLRASNAQSSDTGTYTIPIIYYDVSVTPDGQRAPNRVVNTNHSETFTVTNTGTADDSYELECVATGVVTCGIGWDGSSLLAAGATTQGMSTLADTLPPDTGPTITLAAGESDQVTVGYRVGATAGSGTLTLRANGSGGSDDGSYTVYAIPIQGVAVTPDGGTSAQPEHTSGHSETFTVTNTGGDRRLFNLACSATGSVQCGTLSTTTVTLDAGAAAPVAVPYAVTARGAGELRLTASSQYVSDVGSYAVTVTPPPSAPQVALRHYNADNRERSLCLTSGAGAGAAFQCGELMIAHGMPGFATMGRQRSLTLLYASGTAYPTPIIAAAVTLGGSTAAVPQSVYAELQVNAGSGYVTRQSATWPSWGTSSTAETRQISLAYGAAGDPTGVYPFRLVVESRYATSNHAATVEGQLIVVNRSASPYGRGWHLAGVESLLHLPDGSELWIGGDGSAKVYQQLDATTWVAPLGGYRDTLRKDVSTNTYYRTLRHGIRVTYDAAGRHIRTTNRVGQTTTFTWNGAGQLASIRVPPAGPNGTTYTLSYDANDKLQWIADPGERRLAVVVNAGQLTQLTDPDTVSTWFSYGSNDGRITAQLPRRRSSSSAGWTTYTYGAGAYLASVTIPYDTLGPNPMSSTTTFEQWYAKGYPFAGTSYQPVDTAQVFTKILGPRPDVADDASFWLDRWGAPTKIVDPVGAITEIVRGDPAHPALVTKVTYPQINSTGRWVVEMAYNARGNLIQLVDRTGEVGRPTRTTTWEYLDPDAPDSPSRVSNALGEASTYSYNAWGLTEVATDPRGHETAFFYRTGSTDPLRGLLDSIVERQVETWREIPGSTDDLTDTVLDHVYGFRYDARGNLDSAIAPTKLVTRYVRDAIGRVTDVYGPVNTRHGRVYDVMNRVREVLEYTEAQPATLTASNCDATQVVCSDLTQPFGWNGGTMPNPLRTRYVYEVSGLIDSVIDPRGVTHSYDYTASNLLKWEKNDYGWTTTTLRDPSGVITAVLVPSYLYEMNDLHMWRRPHYDPAGRLTSLVYDTRWNYDPTSDGNAPQTDPLVPVIGDSISYTYDLMGHRLTATNQNGTITRTYYADGSLKSKTTATAASETLTYEYDAAGRLLKRTQGVDWVEYEYNTAGELAALVAHWGAPVNLAQRFTFTWDALGRRREIVYPTSSDPSLQMRVRFRYDMAGVLRRLVSTHPSVENPEYVDAFDFTLRRTEVDVAGRILAEELECDDMGTWGDKTGSPCGEVGFNDATFRYDRRGMLVQHLRAIGDDETMTYDESGNLRRRTVNGTVHELLIDEEPGGGPPYHNRVSGETWTTPGGTTKTYRIGYSLGGDRMWEFSLDHSAYAKDRFYRYDGLGRMVGYKTRADNVEPNTWTERTEVCRYDPDGQLTQPCGGAPWLTFEGANVVGAYASSAYSWHFVHGPGLDDPLVGLYRNGTATRILFWVTDGAGRHLAVGDATGQLRSTDMSHDMAAWRYAGATEQANSFGAERFTNSEVPGLSFFRNRVYDQATGRWTQEDPIGVAGGVNLYQFNGNDPANYSDPFGLCPDKLRKKGKEDECYRWNQQRVSEAVQLVEAAVASGNDPNILPMASNVQLVGMNWDQVKAICGTSEVGCLTNDNVMVLNADRAASNIAPIIQHELQHAMGTLAQRRDRNSPYGEQCAVRRELLTGPTFGTARDRFARPTSYNPVIRCGFGGR